MKRPFRTARQLLAHLRPGETGCLLGGVYDESLVFTHGGTFGKPVVLTGVGAGRATIMGFVEVAPGAQYVTIRNLNIDGATTTQQTVQLFATGTVLSHLDITNERRGGSCIQIGDLDYGIAVRTVVDHDRIHDCGLNASVGGDHGVYVGSSRDAQITNDVIFDSAGFGIQLYPDAQDSLVERNLVYQSGQANLIFAGSGDHASSGNRVIENVFAGASHGFAVTSSWDGPTGSGNVLRDNCIWNDGRPIFGEQSGFSAMSNRTRRPDLVSDRLGLHQTSASPCGAYGPR